MNSGNIEFYIIVLFLIYFITTTIFRILLKKTWITEIFNNKIRNRDIHSGIKPRIGGLIIIPLFIIAIIVYLLLNILTAQVEILGLIIGAIAILIYGYIDEKYDLHWSIQFIWQFGIAAIVIFSGIGIQAISLPNGELWFIDKFNIAGIVLPRDIITALWIVGLMNVLNWLDGIDGLAGGVGVVGFMTLFILALTTFVNQPHIALMAITLAALYLGFIRFNWHPSKIFLGTYGSMFLGYMLAILALISGGKIATSALVLAFPIIDAMVVISQRIWNRRSIFEADNNHFHHKLLKAGLRQPLAVWIMYSISIIFGLSALILETRGKVIAFSIGTLLLISMSFILTYFVVKKSTK